MLLLLPFVGWPLLLSEGISPSGGGSRVAAVIRLWLGGAVLASAIISLLATMLDYSPRPITFDPHGHDLIPYAPRAGFLLGGLTLCMLLSCGVWGVIARIAPGGFVLRGAVVTGLLMFGAVVALGYVITS
jgi:hypothetical protein